MKCVALFGVLWMVCRAPEVFSVPLAVLSNDVSESSEEDESSAMLEDDITTRGLARLSSAATCLVAGVEYTHGQQIYRADPCEFCLCLDGEMFCWWQDCPPAMEGPCKNQGPFTPCMTVPVAPTFKPTLGAPQTTNGEVRKSSGSTTTSPNIHELTSIRDDNSYSSTVTEEDKEMVQSSTEIESTTNEAEPKNCIVMGQEYREGDSLPHSTGNCLECICGQGGKITCSPHQCVPAGDEINDYHQPGSPRQPNDVF